jgi:shikimate dehydrogenase
VRYFGLIGYPLTHSFSRNYFSEKFSREGITDASYELFPLEDLSAFANLLQKTPELTGLNVTIPYKEAIIPLLQELDETAGAVGAVNTILLKKRIGTNTTPFLTGYNTDVFGFRQSIKPFLESRHERALILGTGGASKAVAYVLGNIGVDCYFVSREKNALSPEVQNSKHFVYHEINEYVMRHFPLIINTTPVGMYPSVEDCPPLPYDCITPSHFLFDLIYNPAETRFLAEGRKRGALTLNGLSMLQQQAEKAWEIWNKQ